MFRSTYRLVNDASALLLDVPALARGFERRTPGALPALLRWADRAEALLAEHRLPAAAELAGLRARILAPAFEDARRRGDLRRRQTAAAVSALHDLQRTVQDALEPFVAKLRQARDLARQLLMVVAQSGAVRYDPAGDLPSMIDRVWALCTGHDQLKPVAAQLRALLSADDIRLLLAEEIDPRDFPLEMGMR